jgi:hypothetical protein
MCVCVCAHVRACVKIMIRDARKIENNSVLLFGVVVVIIIIIIIIIYKAGFY